MPSSTASPSSSSVASRKRQHVLAAIRYRIEIADENAHLFRVTLQIAKPAAKQQVSLPVWIPGSYLVREFAKNLQRLEARQGARGAPAACTQIDKCTWRIDCTPDRPLEVQYEVQARDNSVRTAWLDADRAFFNGTSLCLRVEGQHDGIHELELRAPKKAKGWSAATGLAPHAVDAQGFGIYRAADYDELVDCPVEMGTFWSGRFTACGVPHRFVVAGALPGFDGERLLADAKTICETQIRFWHGTRKPPFKQYLFMLNAVDDAYGGLEHRNSTALICKRKDLPRLGETRVSDGYTTLRGLISHEYFHTWNVKRLRPAEFAHYDYTRENYTQLLWFFEGFTSYYDDLLLRRAGLLDNAGYLKLLGKTVNQVMQTPGRLVQSVADASFDAWVKYYRQDENTPNSTVSYYTKGALVALCFDLTLRAEGAAGQELGAASLDAVMRALWLHCAAGPMHEADFLAMLDTLGGRSFAPELASWVHSTDELPLKKLLEHHGVSVLDEPAQLAQRLGLRVDDSSGVCIKVVLHGGAAEQAGFAPGDEWLGIEIAGGDRQSGWRLRRLDDLTACLARSDSAQKVVALVSRDQRLLRLNLTLPPAATTWRLAIRDAALIDGWLSPAE
jgi:predicted metalloprotease with PDZ domain